MTSKDRRDPICGMQGTIKAYGHYFCSEACIREYEKRHNLTPHKSHTPSTSAHPTQEASPTCDHITVWYKEKLLWTVVFIGLVLVAHLILDFLGIEILHDLVFAFYDYLRLIWLPILIGLILGGVIDYFVPQIYIIKYLSRHKKRTIIYSVLLGFLMSACSHIAMELYKKGASTASTIAFLLASPWANLPVTILLVGLFGVKGIIFIVSAIVVAIITGFAFQFLEKRGLVESNPQSKNLADDFSVWADIRQRWQKKDLSWKGIQQALKGVMRGA